jgi:hypothetical protein
LATAEELHESEHHTVSRVRGPSGDLVSEVEGEFAMGGGESASPEWLTGIIVPSVVQVEITEEGTYMIEHEIDDSSNSLPIHVVQGLPPGAEPPDADAA